MLPFGWSGGFHVNINESLALLAIFRDVNMEGPLKQKMKGFAGLQMNKLTIW